MSSTQKQAFERWWNDEGSTAPKPGDDMYEHCKRMCEIAWANGADTAAHAEPVALLTIRDGCPPEGEKTKYITFNVKARLPALANGTYGLHLLKDPQPIIFPKPTERKS
jgi:hypothetical protein